MNSRLFLIKRNRWGAGVKQHWQGVQGKSKRQTQGRGEELNHCRRRRVFQKEEPVSGAGNGQDWG